MSEIFESIKQWLLANGFTEGTNEEGVTTFTHTFEAPRKQVIINGKRMETPVETYEFVITSLGKGSMWNVGEEEQELQGFNMADNDIWVDSLEDFKFWIGRIFSPSK